MSRIYRAARLAYYRWALREISPSHPDVPHIVARINSLSLNLN